MSLLMTKVAIEEVTESMQTLLLRKLWNYSMQYGLDNIASITIQRIVE